MTSNWEVGMINDYGTVKDTNNFNILLFLMSDLLDKCSLTYQMHCNVFTKYSFQRRASKEGLTQKQAKIDKFGQKTKISENWLALKKKRLMDSNSSGPEP